MQSALISRALWLLFGAGSWVWAQIEVCCLKIEPNKIAEQRKQHEQLFKRYQSLSTARETKRETETQGDSDRH